MVDHIARAVQFFRGIESSDVDMALEYFAPESSYLGIVQHEGKMRRKLYSGRKEVRDYMSAWVAGVEDLAYAVRCSAAGDGSVFLEWEASGITSNGPYENVGVNVFEFTEEGLISDVRTYFDWSSLTGFTFTAER